jgi:hypothetical protein
LWISKKLTHTDEQKYEDLNFGLEEKMPKISQTDQEEEDEEEEDQAAAEEDKAQAGLLPTDVQCVTILYFLCEFRTSEEGRGGTEPPKTVRTTKSFGRTKASD